VLLSQGRAAHLPPTLANRLLQRLLELLPGAADLGLQLQCLDLMLAITKSDSGALTPLAAVLQANACGAIVSSLQSCLLQPNACLQSAAAQLLGSLALHAPPAVVRRLIESDACEYLFEQIRGSLAPACDPGHPQSEGQLCAHEQEMVQYYAVSALQRLSNQGPLFVQHLHFGADTIISLTIRAAATNDTSLLADSLCVLGALAEPGGQDAARRLPRATAKRLAGALVDMLPEVAAAADGRQPGAGELRPSEDMQAAFECACM
jgi:hypothetical protein